MSGAGQRLVIDWTACRGRGVCTDLLAGVLRADPWNHPLPVTGASSRAGVPVPPERAADAREAVRLCPRLALSLAPSGAPGEAAAAVVG